MAHQIERTKDLFSVRELPWHGLGTIVEEAPNSIEAIKLAGLDWEVIQEPIHRPDGRIVEDHFLNIRQDTDKILGIVTKQYKIIQNYEAFRFTDSLLQSNEDVKYETAGCLAGGRRVWILAKLPETKILGEQFDPYLCFTHGHDGFTAVKAVVTPVRVVCNNTLSIALERAERAWSAKHYQNINNRLEEARITLGLAQSYLGELSVLAEDLARKKLRDMKVLEIINTLIPLPEDASALQESRVYDRREELWYRYKGAPDLENFRNTGWGLVGAVSDYVTHTPPRRRTATAEENRFARIIEGRTELDKAVELVKAA